MTSCVSSSEQPQPNPQEHKDLSQAGTGACTPACTRCPDSAHIFPDLAKVIDAWPDLPEAVKAGIVAMVHAAKGSGKAETDGADG